MPSTIVIPTDASLNAQSDEVGDNQVAKRGDYDIRVANALIDVATAASTDIAALQAGSSITGVNGTTVPAGGALTTGNVLQVSGAAATTYAAVNLAGGANYVTGVLPSTNVAQQSGSTRTVRGVVYSNVADLTAFTVASDDGITYVEGNRVGLVLQTTGAQCGIYVVGVVGGGTAPLTRATDMPAAAVMPNGLVMEVSEGTFYAGSSWKAMSTQAGGWTVGTHNPTFYPRNFKQTVTLSAGTYKIGFGSSATPDEPLFLFSTTTSMVNVTRDTAGGTLTGTVMYACPVATRVSGLPGTANIVVNSVVEAGTLQNQDTSTLSVLVTNW